MNESRVTRESQLEEVLNSIRSELPDPAWVALVDSDGLPVACVPKDPEVSQDQISAMTAASVMMAERVLGEIEGGSLRFASIAGSKRQQLTVVLSSDRLLTVGLGPEVPAHATFRPLGRWVPELIRVLQAPLPE